MKIGDRVLLHPYPFQGHIPPTLGIVTRVHQTGWIDATMFPDMDMIRDLSFPTVKAVGPICVVESAAEPLANYRGGFIAVPLDLPPVLTFSAAQSAALQNAIANAPDGEIVGVPEAVGMAPPPSRTDAPRQRPRHTTAR